MATKRPAIRLGERISFPGTFGACLEARGLFWDSLIHIAPEVDQDFKEHVVPKTLPIRDKITTEGLLSFVPTDESGVVRITGTVKAVCGSPFAGADTMPTFKPVTEAITEWAKRHNLNTLWIKDWAWFGLLSWEQHPTLSSPEYQCEIRMTVDGRDLSEAFGPIETIELREIDHIKWLVLYQVKRLSFGRIARDNYRGRKTVEDGVKKFASLIGLPLRSPTKGGRPRMGPPKRESLPASISGSRAAAGSNM